MGCKTLGLKEFKPDAVTRAEGSAHTLYALQKIQG